MKQKPLLILVAGPYRTGTNDNPTLLEANVQAMTTMALQVYRKGHLPLVGEWVALPLLAEAGSTQIGDAVFNELFHPSSIRMVLKCDAVFRMGGPSVGADDMVRVAQDNGKLVFYSLDAIPDITS